jgi:hypothetical protein
MKLKRAALIGTATAVVGAGALATAVTLTSAPAKAASFEDHLLVCNALADTNVAVDAWQGSTFIGKVSVDDCRFGTTDQGGGVRVDFFLDNLGINIGHVTFAKPETIAVTFTGTKSHVTEHVVVTS